MFHGYRGRSVSRIIQFLCAMHHSAEHAVTVGDGRIYYGHDQLCATFDWDGDTDVPIFQFEPGFEHFAIRQAHVRKEILKQEDDKGFPVWSEAAFRQKREQERAQFLAQYRSML